MPSLLASAEVVTASRVRPPCCPAGRKSRSSDQRFADRRVGQAGSGRRSAARDSTACAMVSSSTASHIALSRFGPRRSCRDWRAGRQLRPSSALQRVIRQLLRAVGRVAARSGCRCRRRRRSCSGTPGSPCRRSPAPWRRSSACARSRRRPCAGAVMSRWKRHSVEGLSGPSPRRRSSPSIVMRGDHLRLHRLVGHGAGRDQHAVAVAGGDVAGGALVEPEAFIQRHLSMIASRSLFRPCPNSVSFSRD